MIESVRRPVRLKAQTRRSPGAFVLGISVEPGGDRCRAIQFPVDTARCLQKVDGVVCVCRGLYGLNKKRVWKSPTMSIYAHFTCTLFYLFDCQWPTSRPTFSVAGKTTAVKTSNGS